MDAWWNSLAMALRVFYALGIASAALLALQMLALLFGLGGDHDLDSGGDLHDSGLGFLSVRTLTAFFAGFGWTGVVAIEHGLGLTPALILAVLVGGLMMFAVFFTMKGLYSLRASGTLDYQNALGAIATVYLPIPPRMKRAGQVEVIVQGRLCVVSAFTRAGRTLPNRARVRVSEVIGPATLVVEPLDASGSPNRATGDIS